MQRKFRVAHDTDIEDFMEDRLPIERDHVSVIRLPGVPRHPLEVSQR